MANIGIRLTDGERAALRAYAPIVGGIRKAAALAGVGVDAYVKALDGEPVSRPVAGCLRAQLERGGDAPRPPEAA